MNDPLLAERDAVLEQIDTLTRDFDAVVAASQSSNADDEHDPEGSTIAFERQQVVALLEQARRRLADVDAALARRSAGSYGVCEQCGRPIGAERLAAARRCAPASPVRPEPQGGASSRRPSGHAPQIRTDAGGDRAPALQRGRDIG